MELGLRGVVLPKEAVEHLQLGEDLRGGGMGAVSLVHQHGLACMRSSMG
jgi:hypothetical protein